MSLMERVRSIVRWESEDHAVGVLEGRFYPLLKDAEWAETAAPEGTLIRPLAESETLPDDIPRVAYAVDLGESVAFLSRTELPDLLEPDEIHRVALGHLREVLAREGTFEELGAEESSELGARVLLYSGSYYAAEAILLPEIMREAQSRLGAEFMGVVAPARGELAMIDGNAPDEALAGFAAVAMQSYFDGPSAPISTHVFAVRDGQVIGCLGGLESMRDQYSAEATRRRDDRAARITASEIRLAESEGETVVLSFLCREQDGSLTEIEGMVRRWALAHLGDESLSGRIRVEIGYPSAPEAEREAIRTAAHDLEQFLNRQLAGLEAGPREGQPFTIRFGIRWPEDPAERAGDDARDASPRNERSERHEANERNEMSESDEVEATPEKVSFTEDEQQLLSDAPFLVFLVVAAADGRVDAKEAAAFQQALVKIAVTDHPVLSTMFARGLDEPMERMQKLLTRDTPPGDALRAAGELLSERLPRDEANAVKMALLLVGKHVAEASGGIFGFGNRISRKEKKALAAVLLLLDIQVD